ncbi:MAG TPA: nucleotide sugar dehydrogenase [Planctomycetota bacterium]|nr:nucleotide sugar dehydrogenase [Planctomycetota bacterium]
MNEKIAVVGLGYVGLPLALAVARKFPGTIGFDINEKKLNSLKKGIDATGEVEPGELQRTSLKFTSDAGEMANCTFFIVAVPTPIDAQKRPDLSPMIGASEIVGSVLQPGSVVVFESTVYPGVTEDICGPVLQKKSGLKRGTDFKLGYSPERINPGDKEHTLERIVKVVSGEDAATLERVAAVYSQVVPAGIHRAPSIRVAEAAKVIENTQRDLNIALMNELAMIFDRMHISTRDVLEAAGTKWNFLKFRPGLVGGHCIGVDPYYLTTKAEELGYHPQVILAGRRINDGMGAYVAQRTIKMLAQANIPIRGARIGVLGLTFKEDVPDLRNSRVPDIVNELHEYGVVPLVHDPLADGAEAHHEYGIHLSNWEELTNLEGVVVAVAHQKYRSLAPTLLASSVKANGVCIDVKGLLQPEALRKDLHYWSLT